MKFTQEECSEMFRMGTLNGKKIERSNFETLYLPGHQLKRCFVNVNGLTYRVCQYFDYQKNKKEAESAVGLPRIIVDYVVTEVKEK